MAALNQNQTERAVREFLDKFWTPGGQPQTMTKPELRDAVTALNAWLVSIQAGAIAALVVGAPGFNTKATNQQKAALFACVVMVRQGLI